MYVTLDENLFFLHLLNYETHCDTTFPEGVMQYSLIKLPSLHTVSAYEFFIGYCHGSQNQRVFVCSYHHF